MRSHPLIHLNACGIQAFQPHNLIVAYCPFLDEAVIWGVQGMKDSDIIEKKKMGMSGHLIHEFPTFFVNDNQSSI